MTFMELLTQYKYIAWALTVVSVIVIVAFSIKFYFLRRQREIEDDVFLEIKQIKTKSKTKKVKLKAEKKAEPVEEKPKLIEKIKSFSLKRMHKFLSFARLKEWYKDKYLTSKTVLINMELVNGFHRLFTVVEKDSGFLFRKKKFLFDDDSKYYNIDVKLYCFDYHEDLVLPIKRKFPVSTIKKTLESIPETDIEYAINPSTLQRFMTAKLAEGVMKGTQIDDFLHRLQMFVIVIMITVVIHLILFLYGSGMLQNIQVPGM